MRIPTIRYCGLAAAGLLLAGTAQAFDMGNMMNPSKWMGGNKDDDRYDDYYGGPGGYGYPGGYGGPGYGYPGAFGGAPGYGYGNPGYGAPGYGAPGYGAPGYGAPGGSSDPGYGWNYGPEYNAPATAPAPRAAPQGDSGSADEIRRLKERVRQLEQSTQPPPAVWGQPGYQYR